jgi:hypothetical protein
MQTLSHLNIFAEIENFILEIYNLKGLRIAKIILEKNKFGKEKYTHDIPELSMSLVIFTAEKGELEGI